MNCWCQDGSKERKKLSGKELPGVSMCTHLTGWLVLRAIGNSTAPPPEQRVRVRATIRSTAQGSVSISGSSPFRTEYERFEIEDFDRVEMISLHALFQF